MKLNEIHCPCGHRNSIIRKLKRFNREINKLFTLNIYTDSMFCLPAFSFWWCPSILIIDSQQWKCMKFIQQLKFHMQIHFESEIIIMNTWSKCFKVDWTSECANVFRLIVWWTTYVYFAVYLLDSIDSDFLFW